MHQTEAVPGAANLRLMADESAELVENDNLVSHDWVLTSSNYYLTFSRSCTVSLILKGCQGGRGRRQKGCPVGLSSFELGWSSPPPAGHFSATLQVLQERVMCCICQDRTEWSTQSNSSGREPNENMR